MLLIDSRFRGETKKRYVWIFDQTPTNLQKVWEIVVDSETLDPDDRESYMGFAEYDAEIGWRGHEETFNSYWNEYGFIFTVDIDDEEETYVPWHDMIVMDNDSPARPIPAAVPCPA